MLQNLLEWNPTSASRVPEESQHRDQRQLQEHRTEIRHWGHQVGLQKQAGRFAEVAEHFLRRHVCWNCNTWITAEPGRAGGWGTRGWFSLGSWQLQYCLHGLRPSGTRCMFVSSRDLNQPISFPFLSPVAFRGPYLTFSTSSAPGTLPIARVVPLFPFILDPNKKVVKRGLKPPWSLTVWIGKVTPS